MVDNQTFNSLKKSCDDLFKIVDQLKENNAFLTETIEKAGYGEVTAERRELVSKTADAEFRENRANALIIEYKEKLAFLKKKEDELDRYIESKAKDLISDKIDEYQKKAEENEKSLEEYKYENDKKLKGELALYKRKRIKLIAVAIIGIAFGAIGIIINFL